MKQKHNIIFSLAVFVAILCVGAVLLYLMSGQRLIEHRHFLDGIAITKGDALHLQLGRSLAVTNALAAIVRQGEIRDFDHLAAELTANYTVISALQLAPEGVVTQIYPLEGNEAALGHNLLTDPNRREEALAAIEARQLTLVGPFELIQGGLAVVGRHPVFTTDEETDDETFWGFVIVVIRVDKLLSSAKMEQIKTSGMVL